MKIVFDNNLSRELAQAMQLLDRDHEVSHITDHVPADTDDEVWLRRAGAEGWIVVTRDKNLKRKPAELKVYRTYKVAGFWLDVGKTKNLTAFEIAEQVVRNWRTMKEWAGKTRPPYLLRVPNAGMPRSFEDILPP
ncbi:MAG: DUF5615 family PIN-like protein [Candidatus Xenobia bacterium]